MGEVVAIGAPFSAAVRGEQLVAKAHVDRSTDLGAAGYAFRLARSAFLIVR